MVRRRVIVQGHVQGVFFRDACECEAARHGVDGWVRNRDDGTVEAVFEGEQALVDELVSWCRQGPNDAEVTRVETFHEDPEGLHDFDVR